MPHATAKPASRQPAAPPQAAPATLPPAPTAAPDPTPRRHGNPTLALAPRCGARTRAGCPCQAPAIRGRLRCRMHGGRSTGPRTAEGMARIRAARTSHGGYGADTRAFNRHHVTFLRRSRVRMNAVLYCDRLPPDLAARMNPIAPELLPPPRPTRGLTRAEDRGILQAETEALAPWKLAIGLVRQTRRRAAADRAIANAAARAAAEAHAPVRDAGTAAPLRSVGSSVAPADAAGLLAGAHAPDAARSAAAAAGTRADAHAPEQRRSNTNAAPAGVAPAGISPDVAEPHGPERLGRPAAAIRPRASAAARAEAHAPDQRRTANGATEAAEAPAAPDVAKPHAPERLGPPTVAIRPPAAPAAQAGAHAPEPRSAANRAADAAEGQTTPDVAEPHAPERWVEPPRAVDCCLASRFAMTGWAGGTGRAAPAPRRRGLRRRLLSGSVFDFPTLGGAIDGWDAAAMGLAWPGRGTDTAGG